MEALLQPGCGQDRRLALSRSDSGHPGRPKQGARDRGKAGAVDCSGMQFACDGSEWRRGAELQCCEREGVTLDLIAGGPL